MAQRIVAAAPPSPRRRRLSVHPRYGSLPRAVANVPLSPEEIELPKEMIRCSQEWWLNWQSVQDEAISTLETLTKMIYDAEVWGKYDSSPLLGLTYTRLQHLKRQLEAVRIPF